jgi:Fic family protein
LQDHYDALGHRDAFEAMVEVAKSKSPIDDDVIIDVHKLVLAGKPSLTGSYRWDEVTVGEGVGAYVPPSHEMVPGLMQELLDYYVSSVNHPIEKIAFFHLDFENIHPFFDGNGRTGRLLMNLQLIQNGYVPINIKFTDINLYYPCFDDYQATHNANRLAILMSKCLAEELDMWLNIIQERSHGRSAGIQ